MIAVVSGGTKGIGRAISELFLEQGMKVYISSRTKDNNFSHENLVQFEADLSAKSGVNDFADFIKAKETQVDILVNNVGVFVPGSLMDEEDGMFELQLDTNLASTYHLTRALISEVRKSDNAYIYNICSTASITPYMNGGSYCISKYAQLGFTKVLREELKPEKIRVSAVLPGATMTNSWSGTDLPTDRFIQPSAIAQLIWAAYQLPSNTVMEEILVRPMDGDIT
jgi:NAD(P)-dependent dehydrogenase (short-subunit alcohol dehydrogenase family)